MGEEKEILLRGKVCAYLTCRLMGDPNACTRVNKDCTAIATAPVLPVGYVVSASRIVDRRMILAGYRLADVLTRLLGN